MLAVQASKNKKLILFFSNKTARIHFIASLVQLVERWSPKPNVEGSSPSGRVKNKILNKE